MAATGELIRFRATASSAADRQTVFDTIRDLRTHAEWAGTRSQQKAFRLLSLDAPTGLASVGTTFASTGSNMNGTFHDASVVTVSEPHTFAFETMSRLERRHGAELLVHFDHRYDVETQGARTRIRYSCRAHDGNYRPYWLRPGMRTMTRSMINRSMARQLRLLAELAEERAALRPAGRSDAQQ